ncbi:T-cell immunomodulatory protein isoform X3 [Latimeria chalumnae]|uniref:T-cell immunomodulatory protein isoform X3 n=1 Tax=Latimeria chalumnae TaxID=7897 RepID=UPI00313ABA68
MKKRRGSFLPLLFFLSSLGGCSVSALQNVTAELFGSEAFGTVAAFGDFNSDKQTDLFVIRGKELVIFLADKKAPYFKPQIKISLKGQVVISSVVPGDYDGDSQMDVLLTTFQANSDETSVNIFWNQNQTLDGNRMTRLSKIFLDEPLIMDFNGDLIPDVFGAVTDIPEPQVVFLIGRDQSWHSALETHTPMNIPHSHAFIDLNKDFTADLFLTTYSSGQIQFETWLNKDGNFSKANYIKKKPEGAQKTGQSVFADFDGDGLQDHLLPVCMDQDCLKSIIYLVKPSSDEWVPVLSDFGYKGTLWGFVSSQPGLPLSIPITLHMGDYNMDGYPDALAILKNMSGSAQWPLLQRLPTQSHAIRRESTWALHHVHHRRHKRLSEKRISWTAQPVSTFVSAAALQRARPGTQCQFPRSPLRRDSSSTGRKGVPCSGPLCCCTVCLRRRHDGRCDGRKAFSLLFLAFLGGRGCRSLCCCFVLVCMFCFVFLYKTYF